MIETTKEALFYCGPCAFDEHFRNFFKSKEVMDNTAWQDLFGTSMLKLCALYKLSDIQRDKFIRSVENGIVSSLNGVNNA